MKYLSLMCAALAATVAANAAGVTRSARTEEAVAGRQPVRGAMRQPGVCADPARPCNSSHKKFAPYELSFPLPAKIRPNTPYSSRTFHAVILQVYSQPTSHDWCGGGEYVPVIERDRKTVQQLFPRQKAFASHQCPDMAAVSYVVGGKTYTSPFLAVYGGPTAAQANVVLQKARRKYPRAVVRPLRVVYEQIVQ